MSDEVKVKYEVNGEAGKQCKDCSMFKTHSDNLAKGDCQGHEVSVTGSCNLFQAMK